MAELKSLTINNKKYSSFVDKVARQKSVSDWVATKTESGGDIVVISEQTLTSSMWGERQTDIQPDTTYEVYINDTRYSCIAFDHNGGICLGNNTSMTQNDYPFCIYWAGGAATTGFFLKNSSLSYPIKLKVTDGIHVVYNKMPAGYLPEGVVMSVNGQTPDENGNVEVQTGGGLEPLIGSTSDITPSEVRDAVLAGRSVVIDYMDDAFGLIVFTEFAYISEADVVQASQTFYSDGIFIAAVLSGDIDDKWRPYKTVMQGDTGGSGGTSIDEDTLNAALSEVLK